MEIKNLKDEIILKNDILVNPENIIDYLKNSITWNNSIISRKTASFGEPYNYSNINYGFRPIPVQFNNLINVVELLVGFTPNNCLINYYYNNKSKMGYHSDQTNILDKESNIVIFSFGSPRILRFKNKKNMDIKFEILLENNSFFSMSQNVQLNWLHSILPSDLNNDFERFSITFRKII